MCERRAKKQSEGDGKGSVYDESPASENEVALRDKRQKGVIAEAIAAQT